MWRKWNVFLDGKFAGVVSARTWQDAVVKAWKTFGNVAVTVTART